MTNTNELSRMKALMNYGLKTESKQYSSVEYSKVGADGKTYGIVREGAKYYIKVSDKTNDVLKENFDYIGGFINRKDNEYTSYANALKNFDLKMMSLKEAKANGKDIIIESWNPDKNEELAVESTNKMRQEILRQRQIMSNVACIREGKECKPCDPFTCSVDSEYKASDGNKSECDPKMTKNSDKATCAEVNEGADPLAWHETDDTINDKYMDTSKGTEIGDSSPFDKDTNTNGQEAKNGVVEEGESMHDSDSQNTPSVGTGEVGDTAPFDEKKGKQLDEELDDLGDSDEVESDDAIDDSELGDEEYDDETDVDLDTYDDLNGDEETDDLEITDDVNDDTESRLDSIESTLNTILSKLESLNAASYDDEPLYDDDDAETEDEPTDEVEPLEGEDEFDGPDDDTEDEDDFEIYESKSYRNYMKRLNEENKLDVFGKHPAYRKEPIQLPTTGSDKTEHGEDWNDDSVHTEKPYGEQIGSSAPFEISPKEIENAIVEAVKKIIGNKKR